MTVQTSEPDPLFEKLIRELANIGRELSWIREDLQDIRREMKFHR